MKKIGIIGGSGLDNIKELHYKDSIKVDTPYGNPSDEYKVYKSDSAEIYSLARHGKNHEYAPHNINYKANIYGFHKLGVTEILSFSSAGAINLNYKKGDLVLTSDAIDFTNRGSVTFYDEIGKVIHVDMSNPFCNKVVLKLKKACEKDNIKIIENGIYVCTNGPRFETPAEINMFRLLKADMVGMTLFPEVTLSKEMGICYGNITLITNSGSGVEEDRKLTSSEVIEEAVKHTKKIANIIKNYIEDNNEGVCACKDILKGAVISK